jgi:uncharacterized protein YndB with AHSA1/START domain
MNPTSTSGTIVEEIEITAPAERVFDALLDPQQRIRWWTAGGRFKATGMESDARPGGAWTMQFDSGGRPVSLSGTYRHVERPRVLEFTWRPGWDPGSGETIVRIELEERAGVTRVRLVHSGFADAEARGRHRGWPELLEALRGYVLGK